MSKGKTVSAADYLESLVHPLKNEIEEVRSIILASGLPLSEHIKWNSLSYCANQDDRVTFNLHGKGYFQIVLHCGAKKKNPPATEPIISDPAGLLNWAAPDRATMKFTDMQDIHAKKEQLQQILRKWIEAAG
ncbi:DUF1801 domain-containing protein [Paenibacillus gansuensis]|uniref:DUF1801 domain-containing protein n=1 Tax=Paenibacillus gansuensis TaxID=306542 RepID=A0ABW5P8V3_9BACL